MNKIWYASSGKRFNEEGETSFYNPFEFMWAIDIENHWNKIKEEVYNLLAETDKKSTSNLPIEHKQEETWSSDTFFFWKKSIQKKRLVDQCPKLYKYLQDIPGVVSFSLNLLPSQTTVNKHWGDTNAVMRCYLGIEVPAPLPECGLRIGTERQGWREGKWLFFNDAFKYSVWNNTDKRCVVIIMDVIRPEFLHNARALCANIRAGHRVLRLRNRVKILKKSRGFFSVPCFIIAYTFNYLFHNQDI